MKLPIVYVFDFAGTSAQRINYLNKLFYGQAMDKSSGYIAKCQKRSIYGGAFFKSLPTVLYLKFCKCFSFILQHTWVFAARSDPAVKVFSWMTVLGLIIRTYSNPNQWGKVCFVSARNLIVVPSCTNEPNIYVHYWDNLEVQ